MYLGNQRRHGLLDADVGSENVSWSGELEFEGNVVIWIQF